MNRMLFYVYKMLAHLVKPYSQSWYMRAIVNAHKQRGVKFKGCPDYIDPSARLDASGGLVIDEDVVISVNCIILTHDWSWLKRSPFYGNPDLTKELYDKVFQEVQIGKSSFIGAGAIILPGTRIGRNCIVGAGAVVKGEVKDYSIVLGNPASVLEKRTI